MLRGGATAGAGAGGAPADDWRRVTCDMQLVDLFATPIMPAQPVEYAAAYLSLRSVLWADGMRVPASVRAVGEIGSPCSGAGDDSDSCRQMLSALAAADRPCADLGACKPFIVTSEGSAARRIDSEPDLLAWLGSIDTPAEAVIVATWKGLTPSCEMYQGNPYYTGRGTLVLVQPDGYLVRSEWQACDAPELRETVKVAPDGSTSDLEQLQIAPKNCTSGRRPPGLQPMAVGASASLSELGRFLAQAATLEAASIHAFQQLTRELLQRGAPAELIAWAARSALEELRHTQLMAAEALRFGATPCPPRIATLPPRSLFELALENAVEGCVRESYGALVAHQQAALARDPQLRPHHERDRGRRGEARRARLARRRLVGTAARSAPARAAHARAPRGALRAACRRGRDQTGPAHGAGLGLAEPGAGARHAGPDERSAGARVSGARVRPIRWHEPHPRAGS
jgi:hypothetical protein